MLPGLDKALGRTPEPVPEPEPTVDSLTVQLLACRAELTKALAEAEMWRGKFRNTDAHVAQLQTEVASLKGMIATQ